MKKFFFLFPAICLMLGCSKPVDTLVIPTLNFNSFNISLKITKDSIISDGVSTAELILQIDPSLALKYPQVTFNISTIGNFENGSTSLTSTIDINGQSKAYVNSIKFGASVVTANVTNLGSKMITIQFVPSYPDKILMQPSVSSISATYTSSININATLQKNNGSAVSIGLPVVFYDSTANNKSIGVFLNTTASNSSGQATATYSIQDTTYHGFLYLKGYVQNGSSKVLGVNKVIIP